MNGCFLRGTSIAVDIWPQNVDQTKTYFLSHLHTDHTKGLTSSWRTPFYTSLQNKKLLHRKFKIADHVVIALELNEGHVIPLTKEGGREALNVTLVDANHVPGAVIFLFQGDFGTIFYSGDMRYYPEIFEHPVLTHTLGDGGIDVLYLDNTFCHPNYDFPSRQQATREVIRIIEDHPNHMIKLGIRTLGKEDLLEEIAQKFMETILVFEEKFDQLRVLRRPTNLYTTRYSYSRIHAVNLNSIHRRNHEKWNQTDPTISIMLTSIYEGVSPHERPSANVDGIYIVPYSDHSSWSELNQLVRRLKPRKIIPIVKHRDKKDRISVALKGNDDMSVFDRFLRSPVLQTTGVGLGLGLGVSDEDKGREDSCFQVLDFETGLKFPMLKRKKLRRRAMSKGVYFLSSGEDQDGKEPCSSSEITRKVRTKDATGIDNSPQLVSMSVASLPHKLTECPDNDVFRDEPNVDTDSILEKNPLQEHQPPKSKKHSMEDQGKQTPKNKHPSNEDQRKMSKIKQTSTENQEKTIILDTFSDYSSVPPTIRSELIAEATRQTNSLVSQLTQKQDLGVDFIVSEVESISESLRRVNYCF